MVGETHFRDIKGIDTDPGAVEDEIYLALRRMAWVRRGVGDVGIFQAGGGKKQIELPATPQRVEITCNNNIFIDITGEGVQLFKLVLPVAIFERQVDDEDGNGPQVGLDYQAFHALLEIMEMKIFDVLFGQQGVALLPQNRNPVGEGTVAILAFDDTVVTEPVGNGLSLAEMSCPVRTGVNLDQGNDIGVDRPDKGDYPLQVDVRVFEKTGKRQRQVVTVFMSGTVTYIIEK